MKVIFLGTNGWYDTNTGNTPCILIQTNDFHIVFDAGTGLNKLTDYIKDEKPIYLFLSHFHLDHVIGLHTLPKLKFKQGISIFGQRGTKKILNKLINHPFTMPIKDLPVKVDVYELPKDKKMLPFDCEGINMFHADPVLGYRLKLENKIISYSGDAGIEKNSEKLAKNADLLIHECTLEKETTTTWGHTNPYQVSNLAKKMGVKTLALVHFAADIYKNVEMRKEAEAIAKNIFPNTIAATDALELTI